ncbi:MAG TPA: ABC transporter permease, partial [Candidatus Limnocylindria bacterium]
RRIGTALLRSRGAGPLQVGAMALTEALVLAVPAAFLAPWVAVGALNLLNLAGPLRASALAIEPVVSDAAYIAAGAAALGCALLLVLPAFLAARTFAAEEGGRSRFETRTIGQRLGIDIALLAVTVIGFWQLRLYGAPLTRSVQGSLGLDPLLVAAPAIGLLAGGVLALRLVPLLASGAEVLTRRGRRLVSALGAQQVSRRPLRYTRSALLLMLAISMGVFAISYSTTWHRSQADQAAYQVGADVRLEASTAVGNVPGWAMRRALAQVPGVTGAMPLSREALRLARGSLPGEVLGVGAEAAAGVGSMRPDLASAPLSAVLQPLADQRPAPRLPALPDGTIRVRLDVDVVLEGLTALTFDRSAGAFTQEPVDAAEILDRKVVGAQLVVRDASGVAQRFLAPAIAYAPGRTEVVVPLRPTAPRTVAAIEQAGGGFTPPVDVLGLEITVTLPEGWTATRGHVELVGADVSSSADGEDWRALDLDASGGWSVSVERNIGPTAQPPANQVTGRRLELGAFGETGILVGVPAFARPPVVSYVPASLDPLADLVIPAVANQAFLDATALRVGEEVNGRVGSSNARFRIAGVLRSFPTADPDAPLLVADLATLELRRFAASHDVRTPDEWWVAADDGQAGSVAAAISGGPFADGRVTSAEQRTATLTADPVALGIIGALTLGFVVAGLFAVIGLSVSAAVSARQRRTEFALLRALGLSSGQLSAWLWLENAAVVVVSLAAGTALGLVIGWVALPFITVTQSAAAPFPPAIVQVPWGGIGVLLGISAAALALTVILLGALLRRIGIGSVLRMGED